MQFKWQLSYFSFNIGLPNGGVPLVIIGVNPGRLGVSRLPRFWAEGWSWGIAGEVMDGSWNIILSCTGSMFESGDFSSEIE